MPLHRSVVANFAPWSHHALRSRAERNVRQFNKQPLLTSESNHHMLECMADGYFADYKPEKAATKLIICAAKLEKSSKSNAAYLVESVRRRLKFDSAAMETALLGAQRHYAVQNRVAVASYAMVLFGGIACILAGCVNPGFAALAVALLIPGLTGIAKTWHAAERKRTVDVLLEQHYASYRPAN